jgi:autotransporter-associated beta strand protein
MISTPIRLRPLRLTILLLLALCLAPRMSRAQFASFPGAVGFGGTAAGAFVVVGGTAHSGGTVYHVTNLNDSGPGSFRTGVNGGGNIVVFDIGGSIKNLSPVSVASNVCIEGQTAPGGIQVYGSETSFYGHSNIICRYMHFRDGTDDPNYPGSNGTNSHTNAVNMGDTNHIIMDHCSFEFAAYNNVDAAGAVDNTFQNCIFADPIREQQFNCHYETGPVTFIDCLWMNSHGRNPLGKANMQFINNIVYNYQYAVCTGDSSGKFDWDILNNYFIAGPSTNNANDCYYQVDGNQQAYTSGNILDSNRDGKLNGGTVNGAGGAGVLTNPVYTNSVGLATLTAQSAYYNVVSNAGPVPRDQMDAEVINDALSLGSSGFLWTSQGSSGLGNDGYGVITTGEPLPDSDGNGMPDDWKSAKGLSLSNAAVAYQTSSTGYTNLENYLNWKALPNAFVAKNTTTIPTSVTINLSQYANGFGTTATYAISNVTGGTATQSGTAPYLVKYVPTLNTSGLGGFNWTVTNSATTMSSTCGILISQSGPTQALRWIGNGSTNPWDTSSPLWTSLVTGSTIAFGAGDPVTFDDSGSSSPAINLTAPVSPGGVEVAGISSNYVLSGTGFIGGIGSIVKDSLGTLTIQNSTANTFSGGIVVNSGTLVLSQGVGTGTINFADGTGLVINNGVSGNTLNITGSTTIAGVSGATFGVITGGGTMDFSKSANSRYDWYSNITGFTGLIELGNSDAQLRMEGSTGSPSMSLDLGNGGSFIYARNGNSGTYSIGSLTGGTNSYLGGASDNGAMTWSIGGNNASTTFPGVIEGTGMSVTKIGTGTLTLTGNLGNYTGTTNINGGTLLIPAAQTNSGMSVNTGGTLVASGTLGGNVTFSGGTVYIGKSAASGTIGTLVTGTSLNILNATLNYDLSSSPTATGSNDQIIVPSGNLNITYTNTFNINMTNGYLGNGVYTLIGGNASASGSPTLASNIPGTNRQNIYLTRQSGGKTPAFVNLNVTGSPGNLTWTGSNGATWDLNTTGDWSGASPNTFYNLDSVTFDDSNTNGNVIISGTVQPAFIYVNNNATNYTISGTGGGIGGNGTLIKTGTGSLQLYPGLDTGNWSIYIDQGTLYAGAWLGNGIIYLNGGTLTVENGTYLGQSIVAMTSGTINSVGGSNWITNNSGATLTSTQPVVLDVVVNAGSALTISGAMDGFQGTFEMGTSGGLVRFNGDGGSSTAFDVGSSTGWFANRNGGATVNYGSLSGGPNTTLGGRQAGSGATQSTYIEGGLNTDSTFAGTITNGGDLGGLNITKVGSGNWTLSGTSNFTGNVEVTGGTLTITGSDNNGGLDFEIQSGAALSLQGGMLNTETVQIDQGATFTGYGTLYAALVNQGTETVNGVLTVNGNFENDGTLMVTGSGNLVVNLPTDGSGTFVNNGLLDIMDSPATVLPAGYVNNGTILTSSLVTVKQFSKTGTTFSVSIQSYSGHTYQLQKSTDLNTWQNVGAAQSGATGTTLTLTDSNAPATGGSLYQVAVGP